MGGQDRFEEAVAKEGAVHGQVLGPYPALHCQIKYKKTHSGYKLYCNCVDFAVSLTLSSPLL
eukprot:3326652-Rhodomonas_salina.5